MLENLPNVSTRRIVVATLVVAAVALAFWLLFHFYEALFVFLAAVVLSIAMRPVIAFLQQRGVPRAIGIVVVFGVLVAIFAAILWFSVPLVVEQISEVTGELTTAYQNLRQIMLSTPNLLVRRLALALPLRVPLATSAPAEADAEQALVGFAQLADLTSQVLFALLSIFAIFAIAFYWTLQSERIKQAIFLLLPLQHRQDAREFVAEVEEKVGRFVIAQALLSLLIGAAAFIAYLLIGLPYAFVLAIFAGILEAVPLIGPVIGAIPAALIAFSISPASALWVIVATAVIQQLESNFLVPRVMKRTVGVTPLVTLLALLAFGSLFGILGALIAIPLAAVIQLWLERYVIGGAPAEEQARRGRDQVSVVRYRTTELINDLRQQIREKEVEPTDATDTFEDSVEAIAVDLETMLAQYRENGNRA